jgi:signal transduction histidine kinase
MHSRSTLDALGPGEAAGSERRPDALLDSLAARLHGLAQPLTILRGAIAASARAGISAERQAHYLQLSGEQVERACAIFEELQDLVLAARPEADGGA